MVGFFCLWGMIRAVILDPIILPFPPSGNTYYRSVRMGKSCRVLLSKAGREYKTNVKEVVDDYIAKTEFDEVPFPYEGRLMLHIRLHAPTRRMYDLDNRLKAVCDALEYAGIYIDDNQIDSITVRRGEVMKNNGRATVQIIELDGDDE
tara:strand:+ start:977 stop:1420 length:444 start_codon:yes stop_codon:yes gene_type:complete